MSNPLFGAFLIPQSGSSNLIRLGSKLWRLLFEKFGNFNISQRAQLMNIKYIFKVLHGNIFISSFGLGLGLRDGSCRRCGILKPIDKYFQISRQIFSILSDKYVQIIRQICSILSYKYFTLLDNFVFILSEKYFQSVRICLQIVRQIFSNYQPSIFNIIRQIFVKLSDKYFWYYHPGWVLDWGMRVVDDAE